MTEPKRRVLNHGTSHEPGREGARQAPPGVKGQAGQCGLAAGRPAGQEAARSADAPGRSLLAVLLGQPICSGDPRSELSFKALHRWAGNSALSLF